MKCDRTRRERNKIQERPVMHNTTAHHLLTSAQLNLISDGELLASFSQAVYWA